MVFSQERLKDTSTLRKHMVDQNTSSSPPSEMLFCKKLNNKLSFCAPKKSFLYRNEPEELIYRLQEEVRRLQECNQQLEAQQASSSAPMPQPPHDDRQAADAMEIVAERDTLRAQVGHLMHLFKHFCHCKTLVMLTRKGC